jgi:hypothetical protein
MASHAVTFDASFAEKAALAIQPPQRAEGDSRARYGANLVPIAQQARPSEPTRLVVYPHAATRDALRANLTDDASGSVFENYPHAPNGGVQHTVNLNPYLFARNRLFGDNAWVTTAVNDADVAQRSEVVRPRKDVNWTFPFVPFTNTKDSPCVAKFPCSWDSRKGGYPGARTVARKPRNCSGSSTGTTAPEGRSDRSRRRRELRGLQRLGHGFGGDPCSTRRSTGQRSTSATVWSGCPTSTTRTTRT